VGARAHGGRLHRLDARRILLPAKAPYAAAGRVAQVDSLFANLYAEASATAHRPVLVLPYETRLEVSAEKDERWLEVRLVDGGKAWIQRGDVVFDPAPLAVPALIEFSKRFLGLPYLWAARRPTATIARASCRCSAGVAG